MVWSVMVKSVLSKDSQECLIDCPKPVDELHDVLDVVVVVIVFINVVFQIDQ